ncbi:uncharacterized protein METZ01_LOCUS159824, partial [marine metagenome]
MLSIGQLSEFIESSTKWVIIAEEIL